MKVVLQEEDVARKATFFLENKSMLTQIIMPLISRIAQNPYRVLGCFSNSSIRDIEKNKSRALAFARVKKTPSFPADTFCSPIATRVPPPSRTAEDIENAATALALPRERLRHAFFWFASDESFFRSALCIFTADSDAAGFVRRVLSFLHTPSKRAAFVASVAGTEFSISESECCQLFLEEVLAETKDTAFIEKLVRLCASEGFQTEERFLSEKILTQSLAEIDACVSNAKEKPTPEANLATAKRLCKKALPLLAQLKKLLSESDETYIASANKVATEILNLSISYYNASDDDDSEDKALDLINTAEQIAEGDALRERIARNKRIIEKQRIPLGRKMVLNILDPLTKKADTSGSVSFSELLTAIDKIQQISILSRHKNLSGGVRVSFSVLSQDDKNLAGRVCFNLFAQRVVEERKRVATGQFYYDKFAISNVAGKLLRAFPSAYNDEEIELLKKILNASHSTKSTNASRSTKSTFLKETKGCLWSIVGFILFYFVLGLIASGFEAVFEACSK